MEICSRNRLKSRTSLTPIISTKTNGFYKFLARFSGRRRHLFRQQSISIVYATLFLLLTSQCRITDACSSRSMPKPRPPTPTPRPNITFHTYKCPPAYAEFYCLNEATCFTVKIGDSLLYNCECADGYMGPRCEYKDLDGSYLPTRPRVMLETASIASGATVALLLVIIVGIICSLRWQKRKKLERLAETEKTNGVDMVDGMGWRFPNDQPERRPFGPHHHHTISMSEAFKR